MTTQIKGQQLIGIKNGEIKNLGVFSKKPTWLLNNIIKPMFPEMKIEVISSVVDEDKIIDVDTMDIRDEVLIVTLTSNVKDLLENDIDTSFVLPQVAVRKVTQAQLNVEKLYDVNPITAEIVRTESTLSRTQVLSKEEFSALDTQQELMSFMKIVDKEKLDKVPTEIYSVAQEGVVTENVETEVNEPITSDMEESTDVKEKAEAEKVEAEKLAQEQAEAEKAEAEKLAKEKAEAEKAEAEKVEAEKLAKEKAEAEKAEAEKLAQEQAEAEKAEAEKLAQEQAEAEKAEAEKLAQEQAEAEKAEAEKLAQEQAEAEKAEAEKLAQEQAEMELPDDLLDADVLAILNAEI